MRGRTKLKQVGTQIQKLVSSMHKAENQSQSLMEGLRELPGRDALRFRAEVASLRAEAKQKRNSLAKEVSKIANYGIPV
ncbi:hypothetical protein KP509_38G047800 [Ceratopteris richardii]|uniref:Uncharacterized protein n=1 Tax=Ceratopteris richardii TaxID=49495 RepID=A0A8T2Q4N2_CERRI|nr:hypothetical protein KP509_38G047800 [Ceratopteris richardii]